MSLLNVIIKCHSLSWYIHSFFLYQFPYTFRRTRATHLLNAGVNIVYIQKLLGYECIETTEVYAKVFSKAKFDAIKKVTPEFVSDDKYADWNSDKDLLTQLINL